MRSLPARSSAELTGLTVVVAGAAGASGVACAERLVDAGARVVGVGSNGGRLRRALGHLDAVDLRVCDLADGDATALLAEQVSADHGGVDGLFHLVGGWRGGGGLTAQSDEDYELLHRNVLTTLRNASRAFYPALLASERGRLMIVSATAVDRPTASNASYAAVKAAAESWVRAAAEGLERDQRSAGNGFTSAAAILVVKALLDDSMLVEKPGGFAGHTHVRDLAAAAVGLFTKDAPSINGRRILLTPGPEAHRNG